MRTTEFLFYFIIFFTLFSVGVENYVFAIDKQEGVSPANAPSQLKLEGKTLSIYYDGQELFKGEFDYMDSTILFSQIIDESEGKINQVYKWTAHSRPLKLTGMISASVQSFPCQADNPHDSKKIVRHSIGLSNSSLNHAVYDRKSDWVLSLDFPTTVRIIPVLDDGNVHQFKIEISGNIISLRFRPRYYQKHRGLSYFEPWNYDVWKPSVAGWCSWFAYFKDISENKIKQVADVLSSKLVPYGLDYLQIDDGYQREPAGLPSSWLEGNDKFPSGLGNLASYIKSKGLMPGIWTYTSFHQKEFALAHKDLFVKNSEGNPAYGNWVGYIMDGSNSKTLNKLIKPVYQGLHEMGWSYYKVDALRHLRYEGYNSYNEYFSKKGIDREKAYRNLVQSIRNEIGEGNFMLGCWGIRPELIGIIDGCRIGGDGFGYAGFAQYNSFNNVVWRNDPDHIVLSKEDAYSSCMVTSLTGSVFMLTDKPEVYETDIVDAARRSIPVMFTLPGQLYDVDPSRSSYIYRVNSELNGDGPRVFDAGQNDNKDYLYLLEINEPYENWMLLGKIGGESQTLTFRELGLDDTKKYLVFEYWTKQLAGSFFKGFSTREINPDYNCQLFCIRELKDHPQLLATDRHITCGAYDLIDLKWQDLTLEGKSKAVNGEEYKLYIVEPLGYNFVKFDCTDAHLISNKKNGIVREISLYVDTDKPLLWSVSYKR